MPQIVKGGKWLFGWVIVNAENGIAIPPEAWLEYGFQGGEEVFFLPGSRHSGGFGLSSARLLAQSALCETLMGNALGRGRITQTYRVTLPSELNIQPGQRLLVGRGSGFALGFIARGRIYETALQHPEITVFENV